MRHQCEGACSCRTWRVTISLEVAFSALDQRVCDCDYCQANPSKLVSHPTLLAAFRGGRHKIQQNGDELANFYYCENCGDLLAVGRLFGASASSAQLLGAISADVLPEDIALGERVPISPHRLSGEEKLSRWQALWGVMTGL